MGEQSRAIGEYLQAVGCKLVLFYFRLYESVFLFNHGNVF